MIGNPLIIIDDPIESISELNTKDHDLLTGLADDDHTQYILADGTRVFAGNQSFGGNFITNALNTNWDTAYTHSQNNSQAHSDYFLNTGDTSTGDNIFDGAVTINNSQADKDFRIGAVGAPNALFVDGATGRIGVGTNAPASIFHMKSPGNSYMTFEDTGDGVKYDMGTLGGYMRFKDNGLTNTTFIRFAGTTSLDLNADTSIKFNTNKNDRDIIFYGDLAEIARFDAGTESLDFDDNQQVKFGTGGDSEIYYDTNLIIDPNVVGTGKVLIGATGNDTINAGAYEIAGVTGANFSGAVTNITVVNGLVTAVS